MTPQWVYRHYVEDDYDYAVAYLEGECTRIVGGCTNPKTKKMAWVHTDFEKLFVCDKVFRNTEEHKKTYQRFDKIVCVSQGAKRGFERRFGSDWGDKLVVRYNMIDGERIWAAFQQERELPVAEDVFSIVSVGNLRPEKGYDRLLPICRRLLDEGYRFRLTIVGGGSEYDNVEKLRNQLHLQNYVTLLGNQSNPYRYMKQADLFLLCSYSEGFSTVVIESVILGLPPMVTDCSGMDEILEGGTYGIIVPNSEEGIYEGLKRVLDDPSVLDEYRERLPQRRAFFDKDNALKEIMNLFEE
jgi:glycosyltransferase involved in cell wall biosynthesis